MPQQGEEQSYDSMLVNWERSKPDFLLWVEHVCGCDILVKELDELVNDENDLKLWISVFDGNFDNLVETTRIYKRKKSSAAY